MHATDRERLITELINGRGFVSFQELESKIDASAATIRRDLARMADAGSLVRIRGGARLARSAAVPATAGALRLSGVPFLENLGRNAVQKAAIGKAAASLCAPGEAVMIDGGSTTLQMCPHLVDLNLQVLTNSLHIVNALLPQSGTKIMVPSGAIFREQNIILAAAGEQSMPRFHAPKLFMGAAALGAQGLMQADMLLVAAERRLIDKAEQLIVLADSSKFKGSSGLVVCGLEDIDTVVTDHGLESEQRSMLARAGIRVVIAD
jgi:DeoR family transcriptional regulator, ulaG and ulaABCDEF operon transcriptional repressor